MKKHYNHNCSTCTQVGNYTDRDNTIYDLYFCPQMGIPTVVARFSSGGDGYTSGLDSGIEPLIEAQRLAVQAGLL